MSKTSGNPMTPLPLRPIEIVIFCDDHCGPVPIFPGCPDLPPDPDPKCKDKCFSDLVKGKKPPWKSVIISF